MEMKKNKSKSLPQPPTSPTPPLGNRHLPFSFPSRQASSRTHSYLQPPAAPLSLVARAPTWIPPPYTLSAPKPSSIPSARHPPLP
jgi:hypothetical protein